MSKKYVIECRGLFWKRYDPKAFDQWCWTVDISKADVRDTPELLEEIVFGWTHVLAKDQNGKLLKNEKGENYFVRPVKTVLSHVTKNLETIDGSATLGSISTEKACVLPLTDEQMAALNG